MSNEPDEIRARYEAAQREARGGRSIDVGVVNDSLADIPRLLEGRDEGEGWAWVRNKLEVCCPEFTTKKPRTGHLAGTKYEVMGWMHIVCSYAVAAYRTYIDIAMEQQQRADEAENEASRLRTHLAEKEKEVERLTALVDDDTTDEAIDKELTRWMSAIRDFVINRSGASDCDIDGGGCEGDGLDATLAEIGQGFRHKDDQIDSLRAQLVGRDAENLRWQQVFEVCRDLGMIYDDDEEQVDKVVGFIKTFFTHYIQVVDLVHLNNVLDAENKRLRECLQQAWDLRLTSYTGGEGYIFCTLCGGWSSSTEHDPAEGPDSITHNDGCLFQVIGDLRRASEAIPKAQSKTLTYSYHRHVCPRCEDNYDTDDPAETCNQCRVGLCAKCLNAAEMEENNKMKRNLNLPAEIRKRGLLTMCQDLHMVVTGTSDPFLDDEGCFSDDIFKMYVDVLEHAVAKWRPSDFIYDDKVLELVKTTIEEANEYLEHLKMD